MDIRLYNKAKSVIEPFAFEKYRKEKIRQQIEASRPSRIQIKKNLPTINQDLALKLMDAQTSSKKSAMPNLMEDNRFKQMFENPDFQVDTNADEYRLLAPVLTRLDKNKLRDLKRKAKSDAVFVQADEEEHISTDDDQFSEADTEESEQEANASSEDDDQAWTKDMKKQYRQIQKDKKRLSRQAEAGGADDDDEDDEREEHHQPKEYKVKTMRTSINK